VLMLLCYYFQTFTKMRWSDEHQQHSLQDINHTPNTRTACLSCDDTSLVPGYSFHLVDASLTCAENETARPMAPHRPSYCVRRV